MIKEFKLLVENKMVDITKAQLYLPPIRLENVSQQLKFVRDLKCLMSICFRT